MSYHCVVGPDAESESGDRCYGLGHIGEQVAGICRMDRQIAMSPLQWLCLELAVTRALS
jgi:hypothetical protein